MAGATLVLVTNAANPAVAKRCSQVVWKAEQVCVVIGSHQVDVTRSAEWLQVTELPVVGCRWFFWLQWYDVALQLSQLCIVSFISSSSEYLFTPDVLSMNVKLSFFALQIVAVRVFKCPWRRSFWWRVPSLQSPVFNLLMVDLHQPEAGPTWRLLSTYLTAFSFPFFFFLELSCVSGCSVLCEHSPGSNYFDLTKNSLF